MSTVARCVCVCVCEYGRVGVAAVTSMQWSMLTPCGQNLGCSPRNRECSQISLVYRVFVFFCKKTTTKQILHTHTRTHKCIVSGHHICCCLVSLHKWLSVEVLVLDSLRGSEMQFYGGHSLTKQSATRQNVFYSHRTIHKDIMCVEVKT